MPLWAWLTVGGGLLVWLTLIVIIVMFFQGAKKLNAKWDRDAKEFQRNLGETTWMS